MEKRPDIVEKLFPHGLVETHLMAQFRQPFGRNAALAAAHLNGITRHQPDEHEGDEHQGKERRQGESQTFEKKSEHECLLCHPSPARSVGEGAR